jgi:small subunit ribosomal protein S3
MGVQVHVNIEEIRKPETDAQLIADSIAQQLEKRIMFRRAMKRAMQNAMRLGAQGIKIMSSGRLNGAKLLGANGIAKAACHFTPCAPISTTAHRKRRPPTASSASRYGCSRVRQWLATSNWHLRRKLCPPKSLPRNAQAARAPGRQERGRGRGQTGRQATRTPQASCEASRGQAGCRAC